MKDKIVIFFLSVVLLFCTMPQLPVQAEAGNAEESEEERQFRQLYLRLLETGDSSEQDISGLNLRYQTCKRIAEEVKEKEGYLAYQCYQYYNLIKPVEMRGGGSDSILCSFHMSQSDSGFTQRYEQAKEIVKEVQSNFDDKMTDLDKLLWINDYIVERTTYINDGQLIRHMGGATLVNKTGVCEGYGQAMQILLKAENIQCTSVQGGNHEWVAVKIDGKWYHVDPTWNDTTSSRGIHYFLMKNDNEFLNTSVPKHEIATVGDVVRENSDIDLTSTDYENWYVHNVKDRMYYYDGYWYYIDNGAIVKNNIKGTALETVISGTNLKITGLKDGVLEYTKDGEAYKETLPKDEDNGDTDSGSTDSGSTDSGNTDSGNTDGGSTDSGSTDSGNTDSGNTDSGSTDSGSTDSGSTDSGNTDSGSTDSGNTDSGSTDSGNTDNENADNNNTVSGNTDGGSIDNKNTDKGDADSGAAADKDSNTDEKSNKTQDDLTGSDIQQPVTKISLSGISKKIAAGRKIQLTVTVLPKNAVNKAVTWKSSNTKYASVSKTGKVTLKKAGIGKTVTITAVAADGSGVKGTYKIKIMRHSVKGIIVKAPSKTLKAGKSMTLKTTVKTTGKSVNKTLKWTSSNDKYAVVNKKGKVTAKKAGKKKTVTITAASTDGSNKKAKIKIKIK